MRVSHGTIRTAIRAHAGGELRRALTACLRQGRVTDPPRCTLTHPGTDRWGAACGQGSTQAGQAPFGHW